MGYYITNLLVNVFLLALYIVQLYAEHLQCVSESGRNVTSTFDFAFRFGFIVLACDTANSSILRIFFRFKLGLEDEKGVNSERTRIMTLISEYNEWMFRIVTVVVCFVQHGVIHQWQSKICS